MGRSPIASKATGSRLEIRLHTVGLCHVSMSSNLCVLRLAHVAGAETVQKTSYVSYDGREANAKVCCHKSPFASDLLRTPRRSAPACAGGSYAYFKRYSNQCPTYTSASIISARSFRNWSRRVQNTCRPQGHAFVGPEETTPSKPSQFMAQDPAP